MILADIFAALAGERHPLAVQRSKAAAEAKHSALAARLMAQRERLASRKGAA